MKINRSTLVIYSMLLFTLGTSCAKTDSSDIPLVSIDVSKAKVCYLEDIAKNIECYNLELPTDYYFGEIIDIRTHQDSLLLFHDYYTKQIHLFNAQGKYINHLNRQGRGPGEYLDIEAFTTNQVTNQLTVYDHLGQKLVTYTLPDFKFVKQQRIPKSLMALTALSEDLFFTVSDEDEGMQSIVCDGAAFYNAKKNEFTACDIPNDYVTVCLSYPCTFSYTDQKYYYVCPYEYSTLYELNEKEATPILNFHFGNKNMPKKLWKSNDALAFEEIVEDNAYALMPQYFLKQDSMCSFFFANGDFRHFGMVMTPMRANDTPKVIKQVKLKGFTTYTAIKPLGVLNNKYVCLLSPHQCKIDEEAILESPVSQMIYEKLQQTQDEGTPILLLFQPKFN